MRRFTLLCCAVLLAGCAPAEEQAEMDMPESPTIALADVAGTWDMQALPETGDSALVTYTIVATDNMEGWTMTFPDREPIPITVTSVDGDSIMSEVGPFPSALRDNVMVTTYSVMRLVDGNLTGTFVARYDTMEADSVLYGRHMGTRGM
jgi:hypothetical protein